MGLQGYMGTFFYNSYTPTGLHWGYQIISIIVAPLWGYIGVIKSFL
jgi:hypothetical protein